MSDKQKKKIVVKKITIIRHQLLQVQFMDLG